MGECDRNLERLQHNRLHRCDGTVVLYCVYLEGKALAVSQCESV
jgi:hypothetical protein